jgi:hypothetical protein
LTVFDAPETEGAVDRWPRCFAGGCEMWVAHARRPPEGGGIEDDFTPVKPHVSMWTLCTFGLIALAADKHRRRVWSRAGTPRMAREQGPFYSSG